MGRKLFLFKNKNNKIYFVFCVEKTEVFVNFLNLIKNLTVLLWIDKIDTQLGNL